MTEKKPINRTKPKSRKGEKRRKKRRNENRKALVEARNLALITGTPVEDIDPSYALNFILDRTFHMLKNAIEGVNTLEPDEIWRDTMVGRVPNEWIRLEDDLRREVMAIAGNMLRLDLDGRRVAATEVIAAVIAPVLKSILDQLNLTPEQQAVAPEIVTSQLKVLEGGGSDATESQAKASNKRT